MLRKEYDEIMYFISEGELTGLLFGIYAYMLSRLKPVILFMSGILFVLGVLFVPGLSLYREFCFLTDDESGASAAPPRKKTKGRSVTYTKDVPYTAAITIVVQPPKDSNKSVKSMNHPHGKAERHGAGLKVLGSMVPVTIMT